MNIENPVKNINDGHWTDRFARIGLIAKGAVYCILGLLSAMAAFGLGGKKSDKQSVMHFIHGQPFGKILLMLVAAGLVCYILWRFIQAFKDTEHNGKKAKGSFRRVRYAFSGLAYAGIAFYAAKLALTGNGGGNGDSQKMIIDKTLELPLGAILVGIGAAFFFGAGIYQFYKAFSGKFKEDLDYNHLKPVQKKAIDRAGKIGYAARGIVWLVLACFLFRAAFEHNAGEAKGTTQAFDFLQDTGGSVLMGLVALGLVAYGLFMFVRAKYEHIQTR